MTDLRDDDLYSKDMLREEPLFKFDPPSEDLFKSSDGKEFNNYHEAFWHQEDLNRKDYFAMQMKNRNWFQKLFNLKPSMAFYDEMTFKTFNQK